jgi:hypothetical protein
MKKNVWSFGLLAGLVVALFMVVTTTLCYRNPNFSGNVSMLLGYTGMLIAFSFVFIGIKNYRDNYNSGLITFGQAFKVGGLIALIGSTLYVLTWLVDYYVFVPDFMDKYAAHTLQEAKAAGASAAELRKEMNSIAQYREMYKNPFGVILFTYMEILPVGLIVTLISALILKRKTNFNQPVTA